MIQRGSKVNGAVVNVLGLAFKENCPDLRNSRVIDLIDELKSYGVKVLVHDPVVAASEASREHGIDLVQWEDMPVGDALVFAVAHDSFVRRPVADFTSKVAAHGCIIDIKSRLDTSAVRSSGRTLWRL